MRAYIVPAGCKTSDELRIVDRPDPGPGPSQVLVRVRAASLNYRDQAIALGAYIGGALARDTVPLSDGAGEVVAVGPGVTRFKPGDRVMGLFNQIPPGGPPFAARAALGSPLDGMLAEQVVLYEDGVIAVPDGLSFEQAACLPCAGVTAWHALMHAGRPTRAGDTVLVLGTGGVSMLALQFAKAAGARVIATSSSDEKLAKALALGASDGINYQRSPDWDQDVMKLTGGRGVDCVVEVGGTRHAEPIVSVARLRRQGRADWPAHRPRQRRRQPVHPHAEMGQPPRHLRRQPRDVRVDEQGHRGRPHSACGGKGLSVCRGVAGVSLSGVRGFLQQGRDHTAVASPALAEPDVSSRGTRPCRAGLRRWFHPRRSA